MKSIKSIALAIGLSAIALNSANACTGTKLKAKDNSVVYGRTLEFGFDIHSNVIVIPRNYAFKGTSPFEGQGMQWKSKYAIVGANAEDQKMIVDGLNEKGLSVGSFYFPGYAKYQEVNQKQAGNSINSVELGVWILSNFSTIDEVKQGLQKIKVSNAKFKPWDTVVPLHYIATDLSGKSLVIEYVDGKLNTYDNKIGAFTNSPTFDWHMTNLRNYINLSPLNVTEIKVDRNTVGQFGQGSGMHGLPGDFTPPSRFVRSAVFTASSLPVDNAEQAVTRAFHILNNFDIPKGAIREVQDGKLTTDITLWTSVDDLSNKRFYFHTYNDRALKMVDLMKFDLNAKTIKVIPMAGKNQIADLSTSATEMK